MFLNPRYAVLLVTMLLLTSVWAEDTPAQAPAATATAATEPAAPPPAPGSEKDPKLRPVLTEDAPEPEPEALYVVLKKNKAGIVVRELTVYKDATGLERKHGVARWFYEDGQLKREVNYRHDVPDGRERWWYTNGKLWMDFSNKKGKLDGSYIEYSRTTQVIRSERWIDGKLQKRK